MNNELAQLFAKPKIIGICGDANTGKSDLIYFLINELQDEFDFNLYSYGLKINVGEQKIYSLEELEQIRNSVIFIDEFFTLLDVEDRKKRNVIEHSLRCIFHNNNIVVLCGLPDNFKKYISSKLDVVFYKKSTLSNFINGSSIKNIATAYKGFELGSAILNVAIDRVLLYDGVHYSQIVVPYLESYDTKKHNIDILCSKSCSTKCSENVQNIVEKK